MVDPPPPARFSSSGTGRNAFKLHLMTLHAVRARDVNGDRRNGIRYTIDVHARIRNIDSLPR